jgi:adenylosuccinate synthase
LPVAYNSRRPSVYISQVVESFKKMNKNIAVLGGSFGDEGKGRIVHYLSTNYDWICKYNGGANAGHTIYTNSKKYVHHLVPSIDLQNSKAKGFLGSGMVIDLDALYDELSALEKDFPGVSNRIYIDPDAFVVIQDYKDIDKAQNGHIGTTNRGIGPAYAAKVSRNGIKVRNYLDDRSGITSKLKDMGVQFAYALSMKEELLSSQILFEASQGVMLDINHGTYPYVSSSDCTASGIYSSGFGFAAPSTVYGVLKGGYATKVGNGPFPTELDGKFADELRERGKEYGAVTKRPRRIGWLDLPALNYAIEKGGITNLIITKLDILNGMKKIPICHKYDKQPMSGHDFFSAKPEYIEVNGWEDPKDPNQTKEFINLVQDSTKTKVSMLSCGIEKSDIINLN